MGITEKRYTEEKISSLLGFFAGVVFFLFNDILTFWPFQLGSTFASPVATLKFVHVPFGLRIELFSL